jgi:Ca2+-binding EF-hand superfamily protein
MAFRRFTGMAQATSRFGSRRPHGDAHAAAANATGLWGAYLRAAANYPLYTALGTSATLWAIGDTFAQKLEGKESAEGHPKKAEGEHGSSTTSAGGIDFRRLLATVTEGSAVGGAAGLYWYAFLDRFVSGTVGLTSGTMAFVAAKLALECFIWHPVSLTSFWTFLGVVEGHSVSDIKKELSTDFVPTLLSEYVLWLPIDALNFWLVPVHLQVLVINLGCLVEAVFLSYVHAHGFPGFGEASHDVRGESSSSFVERKRVLLPSSAAKFCYERLLLPSALRDVERQWSRMDPEGKGSVSAQQLEKFLAQSPLPGLPDANVNAVAARLLVKHAGTGRSLTKKQYIDFVTKLHSTAFRETFLDEVVFSLFDTDQNGVIDAKEAKLFCRVMLNDGKGESHLDVFKEADTDGSGSLSFDEVQALLKKIRANIK